MSNGIIGWQHKTKNGKYFVSTTKVMFSGWETMVFRVINGNVDYHELESRRYNGENEAYSGHIEIFSRWDEKE